MQYTDCWYANVNSIQSIVSGILNKAKLPRLTKPLSSGQQVPNKILNIYCHRDLVNHSQLCFTKCVPWLQRSVLEIPKLK